MTGILQLPLSVHYPFAEQKLCVFATCEESLAENRALVGAAHQTRMEQTDQQQ